MELTDVTVLDGELSPDEPVVIIPLATVLKAIEAGETEALLLYGFHSLRPSGKHICFVKEAT